MRCLLQHQRSSAEAAADDICCRFLDPQNGTRALAAVCAQHNSATVAGLGMPCACHTMRCARARNDAALLMQAAVS